LSLLLEQDATNNKVAIVIVDKHLFMFRFYV